MPKRIEGRGPTLATVNEVERILRRADGPLSLNEIKRRMRAKAVQHSAVRATVDHLGRYGLVVEGSKGVMWVPPASPQLEKAIRSGRRL
jgi:hypothetical protein